MFSLTRFWPMYSSRRFGRTLTSSRASSSNACPDTIRSGCLCCIIRFAVPSAILLCVSSAHSASPRYPQFFSIFFSSSTRDTPFWRAQRLQCAAQQLLEISSARFALRVSDRGFRGAAVVSQIHQRRNDVGLDSRWRGCRWFFCFNGHGFQLVLQLHNHAFRRFASYAWNSCQPRQVAPANRRHKFLDAHSAQNFQRQRRANTGSRQQHLEKMFFPRRNKPVQRQRVFPDMRMDQEGHFGVQLAERGVRRKRHLYEVAHATHVHEHLIRSFFGEPSAKLANHRSPVLPLFLRPSTRMLGIGAV